MDTIKLSGLELLAISLLDSGKPYKVGSKLEGQTFSRFTYNNKVFTVNDKSDFVADFKAGNVKTLTLTPSTMEVLDDEGKPTGDTVSNIQFASHVTNTQWSAYKKAEREEKLEDAKFEGKLSAIRNIDSSKLTEAQLSALLLEA